MYSYVFFRTNRVNSVYFFLNDFIESTFTIYNVHLFHHECDWFSLWYKHCGHFVYTRLDQYIIWFFAPFFFHTQTHAHTYYLLCISLHNIYFSHSQYVFKSNWLPTIDRIRHKYRVLACARVCVYILWALCGSINRFVSILMLSLLLTILIISISFHILCTCECAWMCVAVGSCVYY